MNRTAIELTIDEAMLEWLMFFSMIGGVAVVYLVWRVLRLFVREAAWAFHERQRKNGTARSKYRHVQTDTEHGFTVDTALLPVLRDVWECGVTTTCSCQGDETTRYGLVGYPHVHPGYITVRSAADAATVYEALVRRGANPDIFTEAVGCSGEKEFVVEFAPVSSWRPKASDVDHDAGRSAADRGLKA